jgi:LSD1 subclass zinc finger protein
MDNEKDNYQLSIVNYQLYKWMYSKQDYKPEYLSEPEPMAAINETYSILSQSLKQLSVSQEIPIEFTEALDKNVFFFSGFKEHHQLVEISNLLKDDNGNIKPFKRFLKDVEKIDKTYNKNYLYAEYNFAQASIQMAGKWKEFEEDGDRYNLQYRTAGDGLVRPEHQILNNTTLPASDPFWKMYFPPNGWNCRCDVVQMLKHQYPQSDPELAMKRGNNMTEAKKQQIFRFNPGAQKLVFPPKHPYYKAEKEINCSQCKLNLSYTQGSIKCTLCEANQKRKVTVKTYKNGGKIEIHCQVDTTAGDFQNVYDSCDYFAKQGKTAVITPRIHYKDPKYAIFYASLKDTKYWGKCPDFSVNGAWFEHEGFDKTKNLTNPQNTFSHMVSRGVKQSDRIVVEDCGVNRNWAEHNIYNRIHNENQNISEVYIKTDKGLDLLYKKTN